MTLEASHSVEFNGETYTYLLMGLNHALKHHTPPPDVTEEEEKAQTLALAMTLLHKYRKTGTPTLEFYLQMITLLGHYHEYDKLDIIFQNMNKDMIAFDGRM